jgi:putative transcriptional regulator
MWKIEIMLDDVLKEFGMSQRELSRLTNIRQPSINEMCRNMTQRIDKDNLALICQVLNRDITDILRIVKEQSE